MDDDDTEVIEMIEDWDYALLGGRSEGDLMIPCYSSEAIIKRLATEGYSVEETYEYINETCTGMVIDFIHPIEFEVVFEPEEKPRHLTLVPKKEDMH
jgi:hypothetical protein